jgi:hypothetical protein
MVPFPVSGAVIVLVLVATSEAHSPATASMVRAATAALGDTTSLVVQEVSSTPDDAGAIAAAANAHAEALAEITWGDSKHLVARVRVHVEGAARWSDRELGFEVGDDETERGRTIGYTLASMLPERVDEAVTAPPPSAAPAPPPPPLAVVAPPSRDAPAAPSRGSVHGSIDAAAIAGFGVGGEAGGVGASIAARWSFSHALALRVGLALRAGDVDVAAATSKSYAGALGLAWRVELPWIRRVELGARGDLLVLRESLSHFDFDDATPVAAARWIPGADLLVEGDWRFADSVSLFVAAGGEAAFGTTDVFLAGIRVTQIPPLRGVGELGVRARF